MLIWCAYELLNDYQDQDKKKHPSPYIFNFFFWMRWERLRSNLNNFQVYNNISLTIITILYIPSSELNFSYNWTFVPFDLHVLVSSFLSHGNHHSILFLSLIFFFLILHKSDAIQYLSSSGLIHLALLNIT